MQLKPDETPDLTLGEIRKVTVNLSGAAGINTIEEFGASNANLTITSPSSSGLTGSFFISADKQGTFYTLVSATLSSGEEIKGYVRSTVVGEPCVSSDRDYE